MLLQKDVDDQLKEAVLQKLIEKDGLTMFRLSDVQLTPEKVAAFRDWVGTSTRGMIRIKQALDYLCMKGLLPPQIAKVLKEVDMKAQFLPSRPSSRSSSRRTAT